GVAAVSQISMPTMAPPPRFPPLAVNETELLLVDTPPEGAPNAVDPIELPPVVYPLPEAAVPLAVFEPVAVISRSLNGGVIVNADPPPVPGVIVKLVELVYIACISLFTRLLPPVLRSVMLAMSVPSGRAHLDLAQGDGDRAACHPGLEGGLPVVVVLRAAAACQRGVGVGAVGGGGRRPAAVAGQAEHGFPFRGLGAPVAGAEGEDFPAARRGVALQANRVLGMRCGGQDRDAGGAEVVAARPGDGAAPGGVLDQVKQH